MKWTTAHRDEAVRQGLTQDTARLDQDIRACHTMLCEMDLDERWRADEARGNLALLPVL
jgi:phage FluMu protein gp41